MRNEPKKLKRPLALYIHIPFCVRKCLYCDFLSGKATEREMEAYVDKLTEELKLHQEELAGEYIVETVFIGGGTPTCLPARLLERLGESIRCFPLEKETEYTIEANPGTVTREHLDVFQKMGVNRVSLGLQSACDAELAALGRIHTYADFLQSYRLLSEAGFDNINIDLMADIPRQTLKSYQKTLSAVLALKPAHISSYSLIVEEGTPFYEMQAKGQLQIPDEETDRDMYRMTKALLREAGYERYEISNYARAGRRCRHNMTYWSMGEYLGAGLGAASYFRGERFSNVGTPEEYLSTRTEQLCGMRHRLSKKEEMEEYVFLGLRRMDGISPQAYWEHFGTDFYAVYRDVLPGLFAQGLLAEAANRDRIYLTDFGIDVSNWVLAQFLLS